MKEVFWKQSFFALFLIWLFIRMPYSKKSLKTESKTKKRVGLENLLVFLNLVSGMFLPLFVVFSTKFDFAAMNLPPIIRWLALAIYALNLVLFVWCHKSLGKNWSNTLGIREDHKLIQEGPYKMVRHPMYTHFWLLMISQGLILSNWIVLMYGILAWGTLYFLRVGKEEEMMIEEFGDEYKEYMDRTGRLFPKFK
jgi:protein-S-isoprenylcysteine O-methyltransferase Ste14